MKKSLLALFMGLIFMFGLFGCGAGGEENKDPEIPEPAAPVVSKLSMAELETYRETCDAKQTAIADAILAAKGGVSFAQAASANISVEMGSGAAATKTGMTFAFSALENRDASDTISSARAELDANLGIFGGENSLKAYYLENKLYINGDCGEQFGTFCNLFDFSLLDEGVLTDWLGELSDLVFGMLPELPGAGTETFAEEESAVDLSAIKAVLTQIGLSDTDADACVSELIVLVAGITEEDLVSATKSVLNQETTVTVKFEYSVISTLINEILDLGAEYAAKVDLEVNADAVAQWNSVASAVGAFLPRGITLTVTQSYREDVLQSTAVDFKLLLNVSKKLSLNDFTDLSGENLQKIVAEQIAAYETKNYNVCTVAVDSELSETVGDPQPVSVENAESFTDATEMLADAFDQYVLSNAENEANTAYAAVTEMLLIDGGMTVPVVEEGDEEVLLTSPSDLAKLSAAQLEALLPLDTLVYTVSADETRLTVVTERENLYGVICRYTVSLDYGSGTVTGEVTVVGAQV